MKEFVKALQKGTQKKLERIERSSLPTIQKALEASHLLAEAFEQLKEFITDYPFSSQAEEIEFFKKIKPSLFCRLIYYRQVYNIEMSRPVAGIEAQREYLCAELNAITNYNNKRLDLIRYYRSGATHLDAVYFLRGQNDTEQYLETFYYELDPHFTTNADFNVSKILADDMLSSYLMAEVEELDRQHALLHYDAPSGIRLTWHGTKTELYEYIFALDSKGCFGDVPLTQLASYFSTVFNIQLDTNLSRIFADLSIRNNQTPAIDDLKDALLDRMATKKKKP